MRPALLRRETNIVMSVTTSILVIATTNVAASDGATSFVVYFVLAMNRVDVVALNTIFVSHLSKTGRAVGRTVDWTDGHRTDRRFYKADSRPHDVLV